METPPPSKLELTIREDSKEGTPFFLEPVSVTGDLPMMGPPQDFAEEVTQIESTDIELLEHDKFDLPNNLNAHYQEAIKKLMTRAKAGSIESTERLLGIVLQYQERYTEQELGQTVSAETLGKIRATAYKTGINNCIEAAQEALKHRILSEVHTKLRQAQEYLKQKPPFSLEEMQDSAKQIYETGLEFTLILAGVHIKRGEDEHALNRLSQAQKYAKKLGVEEEIRFRTQEYLKQMGQKFE